MVLNADALRYCLVPLFDSNDKAYSNGVGMLKNIRFAEADVYKTGASNRALFCLESRMENFRLFDIHRDMEKDTSSEAPLLSMQNVIQKELMAEYKHSNKNIESNINLKLFNSVAGRVNYLRQETCSNILDFKITECDHIIEFFTGSPEVHHLPPSNNMVGLSD